MEIEILSQKKISVEVARKTIIQTAKSVRRLLAHLVGCETAVERPRQVHLLDERRGELGASACPFWRIPSVDARLATLHIQAYRYRFLVLEGPSLLGKTSYAESLSSGNSVFLCDSSTAVAPDVREYSSNH